MTSHRVSRGRASQEYLAARLRALGVVHARSRPASLPGSDVEGWVGVDCEIKATEAVSLVSWLRQSVKRAEGCLPLVVYRPRGFGEASLDDWPVIMRWGDLEPLLRAGGYLPEEPGA